MGRYFVANVLQKCVHFPSLVLKKKCEYVSLVLTNVESKGFFQLWSYLVILVRYQYNILSLSVKNVFRSPVPGRPHGPRADGTRGSLDDQLLNEVLAASLAEAKTPVYTFRFFF